MQTHQRRFNVQGEQNIDFNVSLLHSKTNGYAITPSDEVVHLRQNKDNPYDNNMLHS